MIDVSYVCEVTFVVMGKFKLLNFLKVLSLFFFIRVLSVIIVYFANTYLLFYACLRVSVVYSSWLRECSFSLTICRQFLRDLIAVLVCLAKVPFCLGQLDPQMLFQRVYFSAPVHKISTKI